MRWLIPSIFLLSGLAGGYVIRGLSDAPATPPVKPPPPKTNAPTSPSPSAPTPDVAEPKQPAKDDGKLPEGVEGVSVLTWNLQWFPGWSPKTEEANAGAHVEAVADILREADADIVCLQEVRSEDGLKRLLEELPDYRMQAISTFEFPQQVAIISKKDADSAFSEEFAEGDPNTQPPRGFAFAAYDYGGHVLMVYTVHLKSNASGAPWQNYAKREGAAQQLMSHCAAMEEKLKGQGAKSVSAVFAGDFNTTPFPQFYKERTLPVLKEGGFVWGFRGHGPEECETWISNDKFPDAAFDHHFVKTGEGAEAGRSELIHTSRDVSDHRPVLMRVKVPEE